MQDLFHQQIITYCMRLRKKTKIHIHTHELNTKIPRMNTCENHKKKYHTWPHIKKGHENTPKGNHSWKWLVCDFHPFFLVECSSSIFLLDFLKLTLFLAYLWVIFVGPPRHAVFSSSRQSCFYATLMDLPTWYIFNAFPSSSYVNLIIYIYIL